MAMSFLRRNSDQVLISAEELIKRFRDLVNHALHQKGCAITYDQWTVMSVLAKKQGVTQIYLAQKTLKEPASICRILKLLQRKGLIEKVDDKQNKRAKRIYLTPKGSEIEKQSTHIFNQIAAQGFNGVYPQEINLFVRILDKLQGNFGDLGQQAYA